MKYHFKDIRNGQISEGYTTLQITNHEAEVNPAEAEVILLAEKHGGELVEPPKPPARIKSDPKGELK